MHLHRIQSPTASRPLVPCSSSRIIRPVHIARKQRVSVVTPSWKATTDAELTKQKQTGSITNLSAAPAPAVTVSPATPQLASLALTGGHRESLLLSYAAVGAAGAFGASAVDLSQPGSILQALAVLAAIVTVHECGHFFAARLQGIHVSKFAIGFGPSIFKYQGKVVEYTLNAFPLGGFVAFPDDDPSTTYAADDPDLLKNRSIGERAVVISAGVIANFIFAYIVLFVQILTLGRAVPTFQAGVRIPEVLSSSSAAKAGFKSRDIILKIGDYVIPSSAEQVNVVVAQIQAAPATKIDITVQRGDKTIVLPVTPDVGDDGRGRIGVQLVSNVIIRHVPASGLKEIAKVAGLEWQRLANTVVAGLTAIFSNFSKVSSQLSGPVAIVVAGSEIARSDSAGLFQFCAIVNINLGVVNLLPLPALDGGYLMLLLIEGLRGKKLPQKLEQTVMASGFLLLAGVGITLVIRDTLNLIPQ